MATEIKATALAVTLAVALAPVWSQEQNSGDAPDHGVARLSLAQGNVSMRHGDLGELQPAGNNVPLVTTDQVVTGDSGRAEIQFDFTNIIRLAPSTEVRLSRLEFKQYQVQVAAGTTEFRVLPNTNNDPQAADVEISTPTVSIRPVEPGAYRVSVGPDGMTEITVRSGQADIYGPQGSENLAPGQTMDVRGTVDNPEFQLIAEIPNDDFDRFNSDRDRVMQSTSSYRPGYVPPDVTGGESLDQYGHWQYDPAYGQVWVPTEPAGWAPYQEGRWAWEDYYGWTWISYDPWGWAPYHYGSWYVGPWGWAWWPGAWGPHYYWRPALVGFFGWGPGVGAGVGFGFGFGNIGWVPLAPYEAFHPWYGAGVVAFNRVNVTNVNVTNIYRNARVNNGISSMSVNGFGRAPVSGSGMVRPSGGALASAGAIHGSLPVARTAASSRISDAGVNPRGMPQTSSNTRFYSRGVTPGSTRSAAQAPAWRGFNGYNGSRGGPAAGGDPRGFGGAVRGGQAAPQQNYRSAPQGRSPQQQPLRMNPPIVQRSAPPAQRGGGGFNRGGGGGGSRSGGGNRGGGGGHGGGRR